MEKQKSKSIFHFTKVGKILHNCTLRKYFFFLPVFVSQTSFAKLHPQKRNYQKKSLMETLVNLKTILNPKLPITTQWKQQCVPYRAGA
jgi:hypothetical protein